MRARHFYVQEFLGVRVVWTSDRLTRQEAEDLKKKLIEEKPDRLTTYEIVMDFE